MSIDKGKKEEFLTIEEDLAYVRNKLLDIDPNSTPELINDIRERLFEISKFNNKKNNVIKFLVYACITLIITLGALVVIRNKDNEYKYELEQRLNNQIKDYNKKDSLFDKYLGTDSTGSFSTYSVNGKLQSYKDLLKRTVSLEKKNSELSQQLIDSNNKYDNLKFDYDFIVKTYDVTVTKIRRGTETYTNISSKKLEECFGKNQAAAKKAVMKFNALSDSLSKLKPLKVKETKFTK